MQDKETTPAAGKPQCTAILESHGRHWRCTRPAAKKHDNKFCGHCAPKPPRCGGNARFRYHRADCSGCGFDCCADPSLHVVGRCLENGTLRQITPTPAAVPLEDVLAPYAQRVAERKAAANLTRRRVLLAELQAAVDEHDAAVTAWVVDHDESAGLRLRVVRAELALSEAYHAAATLYRPESPTAIAMGMAARYLDYAVHTSPHSEQVRAELAAAKKAVAS